MTNTTPSTPWGRPLPTAQQQPVGAVTEHAVDRPPTNAWGRPLTDSDNGAAVATDSSRFTPVMSLEEARRTPWGRPLADPDEFVNSVTEAQERIAAAWARSHPGNNGLAYTNEVTSIIRNRTTVTTDRALVEALQGHADFLSRPAAARPENPAHRQPASAVTVHEVVWKPGATPAQPPVRRQPLAGQTLISETSRLGKILR